MKITVLHHAVSDSDSLADRDVLVQAAAVEQGLQSLGHQVRRQACTLNLEALEESLTEQQPDIVFNLVESLGGSDRLAHLAAVLLEDLDIPYTGTAAAALHLTNNKPLAKQRMRAAGLPTPDWVRLEDRNSTVLSPPYIIKGVWEHGSTGIDDHSLIDDGDGSTVWDQIASRSRQLGQNCFAEHFIDGRELALSLLATSDGPRILPPAEIDFSALPPGKPKIVGYAAKWVEDAVEYSGTPRTFKFPTADAPLLDWLRSLALDCWRLFELRGYARVDYRVDQQGQPWILEVNANPCLNPDAGYVAALNQAEVPLARALEWIVEDALRRPEPPSNGGSAPSFQHSGPSTKLPDKSSSTDKSAPRRRRRPLATKLRTNVERADMDVVRRLINATGLFRPNEIDVAEELVQARLEKGVASGYDFIFAEQKGEVVGYICFGKNTVTVSSFDVYWIAVEPGKQGQGIGKLLLEEAERQITTVGGTRIYIETSHRADYTSTRSFYDRCGYQLVAVLEAFYAPGDSKAVYQKVIGVTS